MVTSAASRAYSTEIVWWSVAHRTTQSGTTRFKLTPYFFGKKKFFCLWNYCAIFHQKNSVWYVFVCVCWLPSVRPSPGYGISSAGRACGCWKATRSLCAAFASTTKELSAAPTMGQCDALTLGSLCCCAVWVLNWTEGNVCTHSKIKVWDLQAALDPRAPASTLCLRTLVVSVHDFYLFIFNFI